MAKLLIVNARHTDRLEDTLIILLLLHFTFRHIYIFFVGVQAPQRRQYGKFASVWCRWVYIVFFFIWIVCVCVLYCAREIDFKKHAERSRTIKACKQIHYISCLDVHVLCMLLCIYIFFCCLFAMSAIPFDHYNV